MSEEIDVLKSVTQKLDQIHIPYLISGSIASNYYSTPRMTRDLDIVIEIKKQDIKGFIESLQKDFFVDEEMVENEVNRQGIFNLIHKDKLVKVDFITRQPSDFQTNMFERRKEVLFENAVMQFISLEDLIVMKLFWAKDTYSELQISDVRNLIRSNRAVLDKTYIEAWISKLGLINLYKKV